MNSRRELPIYRGCTPVVDAEFDSVSEGSTTGAIIWALADAVSVEPIDLQPTDLEPVIDPAPLDT